MQKKTPAKLAGAPNPPGGHRASERIFEMLNSFVGIGRIVNDAELVDGEARFELGIAPIPRAGQLRPEPPHDIIPVFVPGERGALLAPYLNEGVLAGVRGRLHSREGKGVWLEGAEINFLNRSGS